MIRVATHRIVHCIGIGGIGMSALAELLHGIGYAVSGSDREASSITRRLAELGVSIQVGHQVDLVKRADLVIYSSAVLPQNAERHYAEENGITVMRRAEVLGQISAAYFCIGVAGTHGKTTTTALCGHLLHEAGRKPTVLVGGILKPHDTNVLVENGNILVAEADEFDRSFLAMHPSIAIITNIEADHLECYGSLEAIRAAFIQYASSVPFYGSVVACIDDPGVVAILPDINVPVVTYGFSPQADYRTERITMVDGRPVYAVIKRGQTLGTIKLGVCGRHNVLNSLAAIASSMELGVAFEVLATACTTFAGVKRRFEIVAERAGIAVIDDYAHHPSEISATLSCARDAGYSRRIAVFQPHLYSRTRDLLQEFGRCLLDCDIAVVTGIYQSRETPIEGVSGKAIAGICAKNGHPAVHYVEHAADAVDLLLPQLKAGDALICMGAGDIWKTARLFGERIAV